MQEKELLNHKYLNLCQQLGDAYYKLDQLTQHIDSLKSQIDTLNQCFPLLSQIQASKASKDFTTNPDLQQSKE